jgi:hypothetical protein
MGAQTLGRTSVAMGTGKFRCRWLVLIRCLLLVSADQVFPGA